MDSSECMVHPCEDCPGQDNLEDFLRQKYEDTVEICGTRLNECVDDA